jgi:hypothetical protein
MKELQKINRESQRLLSQSQERYETFRRQEEQRLAYRSYENSLMANNSELGGCEIPCARTAQLQPTKNYFEGNSPSKGPTTQGGRFADRRSRRSQKRTVLKHRSFDEDSSAELETPSLPADSYPQDEMGSDVDTSDEEDMPGSNMCFAATASHGYQFELTLTSGPENHREILDQREFGVHLTVKNGAGSESEEDRSVSDHDTHADHDARAGLRAEHEYELRELEGAEPEYEPGYAAEPESSPLQSDSPHHAGMVECNFSLTREEEEWVSQEHADYEDEYAHSDCEEDFCEEFEDFGLTEEEDDWVSGL